MASSGVWQSHFLPIFASVSRKKGKIFIDDSQIKVSPVLRAIGDWVECNQTKDRDSLRCKRFRGVWEQRRTRNGSFGVLPARKMGREPKMKDGLALFFAMQFFAPEHHRNAKTEIISRLSITGFHLISYIFVHYQPWRSHVQNPQASIFCSTNSFIFRQKCTAVHSWRALKLKNLIIENNRRVREYFYLKTSSVQSLQAKFSWFRLRNKTR